jgi:beta-N-acetylhexosaminidase
MQGAHVMGDIVARGAAALEAGCDMVLVCNHPEEAARLLDELKVGDDPVSHLRLARMHERRHLTRAALMQEAEWQQAARIAEELRGSGTLELEV